MTDETQTEIQTQPDQTQTETKVDPKVEQTQVETKTETKPETKVETKSESPPPDPEKWRKDGLQKRIDKLTAKNKELADALSAKQAGGNAPDPKDEKVFDRQVEDRARVIAEQRVRDQEQARRVNEAVTAGRETYTPEVFDERARALSELVDKNDPESVAGYLGFINAMIETGEAPKLMYELGKDRNEASRIMGLSPVKQGIELARLAAKNPEDISSAPKPIIPVRDSGRSHIKIAASDVERSDSVSTAEWMARRAEEVDKYNKAAGRRVI